MNMPREELPGARERCIENTLSIRMFFGRQARKASFCRRGFFLTVTLHPRLWSSLGREYQTNLRLRTIRQGVRKVLPEGKEVCSLRELEETMGWCLQPFSLAGSHAFQCEPRATRDGPIQPMYLPILVAPVASSVPHGVRIHQPMAWNPQAAD